MDPRAVEITEAQLGTITVRELVQACRVARVRRSEVAGLIAQAIAQDGDPDETARAVELLYALAWQWIRRTEPDATWPEATTWAVTVVGDRDPLDQDGVDLVVDAARLAGVSPREAEQITIAEMDAYAYAAAPNLAGRG